MKSTVNITDYRAMFETYLRTKKNGKDIDLDILSKEQKVSVDDRTEKK